MGSEPETLCLVDADGDTLEAEMANQYGEDRYGALLMVVARGTYLQRHQVVHLRDYLNAVLAVADSA